MKRLLILVLCFSFFVKTNAQIKVDDLLKVYKSDNINAAYQSMLTLGNFKGYIKINGNSNDSIVIGSIASHSITVSKVKNKTKVELFFFSKALFEALKNNTVNKLCESGNYTEVSKDINRHHFVYCNLPNNHLDNLIFTITECRKLNEDLFYELQLRPSTL